MSSLGFTHPLLLWGLCLLPLLWVLLRALPPKITEIVFPGFFFLQTLETRRDLPHKAPWWLILIRILIIFCIILGLARPILNASERSQDEAPFIAILDNGWMAASDWERRKTALLQWANELEGTARQIYIIQTSDDPLLPRLEKAPAPMTAIELDQLARRITPSSLAADYGMALEQLNSLAAALPGGTAEIRWLTQDFGQKIDETPLAEFAQALKKLGRVEIWRAPQQAHFFITEAKATPTGLKISARRISAGGGRPLSSAIRTVTAFGPTGAPLSAATLPFETGAQETSTILKLPVKIANKIAYLKLDGERSAGSVYLLDARTKRADIGLVTLTDTSNDSLIHGSYYLTKAIEPFAQITQIDLDTVSTIEHSVLIFDDIGRLSRETKDNVAQWVRGGGILVQFAGPRLADSIKLSPQSGTGLLPDLLPAPLRRANRSFGGALTWQDAQPLGKFDQASPLRSIVPDEKVLIQRQLLVAPSALSQVQIWASLADGTPLVTAREVENGLLVFFHVTAAPSWSNLPLSQNFVDMLRRITELATLSKGRIDPEQTFTPRLYMDGFGRLVAPPETVKPAKSQNIQNGPNRDFPPGHYGDPYASIAVNAIAPEITFAPLPLHAFTGIKIRAYIGSSPQNLASWFFLIAVILLFLDTVLSLYLRGRLSFNMPRAFIRYTSSHTSKLGSFLSVLGGSVLILNIVTLHANAQEPRAVPRKVLEASIQTRLAYIVTGDPEIDRISRLGLNWLSTELSRRSSLEPAPSHAISFITDDIRADNLSIYPIIYWPITPTTTPPPSQYLTYLEIFMNNGGMLIIDTRDGESTALGLTTPESEILKSILLRMNIPPLAPIPAQHALRRSFYLLDTFPGRNTGGAVWVEAQNAADGTIDGVTPLIISGRDWAAAWAHDKHGTPLRSMPLGSGRQRELAIRTGINIAIVALTGNYKVDQLQVNQLLEDIERETR